jgi:hypothetical protein
VLAADEAQEAYRDLAILKEHEARMKTADLRHGNLQARLKSPLKAVGTHHYVHLDGFHLLPADAIARLVAAESLAQISRGHQYNIARFDNLHNRVALLETGTGLDQEHKTPGRVVFSNLYLTFS